MFWIFLLISQIYGQCTCCLPTLPCLSLDDVEQQCGSSCNSAFNIQLSGPNVTALAPLRGLDQIAQLSLDTTNVLTLKELHPRVSIINLRLVNNPLLTMGAASITLPIGAQLIIQKNPHLLDIQTLLAPTSMSPARVILIENEALRSLEGLESVTPTELFQIENNPALTSLIGLASVLTCSTIRLVSNSALVSLGPAKWMGKELQIRNNLNLSTVHDLELGADYTRLVIAQNSLQAFPKTFFASGRTVKWLLFNIDEPNLCCPAWLFYSLAQVNWNAFICSDCFELTNIYPKIGPISGGLNLTLTYTGEIRGSALEVDFGEIQTANVGEGIITVILPASRDLGEINVTLRLPQNNFTTSQLGFIYMSEPDFFGLNISSSTQQTVIQADIPGISPDMSDRANSLSLMIAGIGAALIIVSLMIYLVLHRCDYCVLDWQRWDYLHPIHYDSRRDGRIKLRSHRSHLGGGLTVLTAAAIIIALVAFFTMAFVSYEDSTVALVPAANLYAPITTTFTANFTFIAGEDFMCPKCNLTVSGFSTPSGFTTLCLQQKQRCTMLWTCPGCTISRSTAQLGVQSEVNGWARQIYWSITTLSHAGNSTVQGYLQAEPNQFFRGHSESQINLLAVRERYIYRGNSPQDGVIMQVESIIGGHQLNATSFHQETGCGLNVDIGVNPALLQINVSVRESLISLLAQTFSLILGILGVSKFLLMSIQTLQKRYQPQLELQHRLLSDVIIQK